MKKFNLTVTLVLTVVLAPGLLIAASEVVIGYANISARVSPLWIAQEKGFFTKFGVNVQQVYMPGSPVMIASMASGQIQLANSGGTAALGAAAGGLDLKVIGTFTSRIPFDLVVNPAIKSPKDLKGKRLGVQVIGGTIWMGAMLGLEHLGLEPRRDAIQVVAAGDQTMLIQALEKGWVDGVAYALSPKMKPSVIETIVRHLKTANPTLAEQGYQDLLQVTDRKPYPSLEGLRNVQRLMKVQNAAVGGLKAETLVDAKLIQELDESGFIDQLYSAYGVKQ